jgi:hypothetical protein
VNQASISLVVLDKEKSWKEPDSDLLDKILESREKGKEPKEDKKVKEKKVKEKKVKKARGKACEIILK